MEVFKIFFQNRVLVRLVEQIIVFPLQFVVRTVSGPQGLRPEQDSTAFGGAEHGSSSNYRPRTGFNSVLRI